MSKPPNPPSPRTKTNPGLGSGDVLRRVDSTEIERAVERRHTAIGVAPPSGRGDLTPEPPAPATRRLRASIRREEDDDAEPTPTPPPPFQPEAPSGMRVRPSRSAIKIDEVGAAAVKLAGIRRPSAPSLVAPASVVAKAPIDSRAAFVLSLVDGTSTVGAIIDASGMDEDEVRAILARLARLGLIATS